MYVTCGVTVRTKSFCSAMTALRWWGVGTGYPISIGVAAPSVWRVIDCNCGVRPAYGSPTQRGLLSYVDPWHPSHRTPRPSLPDQALMAQSDWANRRWSE